MKYTSKKVLLTILLSALMCLSSAAAEVPDFGEHPNYIDIDNVARCSGTIDLPGGELYEAIFMRSDGEGPTAVESQDGGRYYMTMPEGYELSYSFLINDGNKEQRQEEEEIVEPIYIESINMAAKSPLDSTMLTRNTRKGSRIMYDLPSGYEYHSGNGGTLKIQKIVTIASLKTGETVETIEKPIYLKHLKYRIPDKDRRMKAACMYKAKQGDYLWNIEKKPIYLKYLEYRIPHKDKRKKDTSMYEIKPGDNLWNIAKQVYGNPEKWISIYTANQDILKNPDLIYAGMELVIP